MRNTFCDTIVGALAERDDVYIISGDAGLGVFDDFRKRRPDRFVNLGVAEQNMLSHAAGMAMAGFRVFVYNIVPFVLYRSYEQVRNDICYQKLPVTLIGIGSGLTYAPQGMTHYSVEDLGIALTLPNLRVFSPADPAEASAAAHFCLDANTPCYVRLAKRGEPVLHPDGSPDVTRPLILRDGRDIALIGHGSIVGELLKVAHQLADVGAAPRVISLPQVAPLEMVALDAALAGCRLAVVVEEHYGQCGLGARIAHWRALNDVAWRMEIMALPDTFVHVVRDQAGMREHYGISSTHIAARLLALLREGS